MLSTYIVIVFIKLTTETYPEPDESRTFPFYPICGCYMFILFPTTTPIPPVWSLGFLNKIRKVLIHPMRDTCPTHLIFLNNAYMIRKTNLNLLIMHFLSVLPLNCNLGPNILLSISNALDLRQSCTPYCNGLDQLVARQQYNVNCVSYEVRAEQKYGDVRSLLPGKAVANMQGRRCFPLIRTKQLS